MSVVFGRRDAERSSPPFAVTVAAAGTSRAVTTYSGKRVCASAPSEFERVIDRANPKIMRGSCILGFSMSRILPPLVLAMLALTTLPRAASADPRTSFLIEQLKSDDYRVRTQAALALGSSGDDSAIEPLCGALADAKASVKAAAASALGKLGKPAGLPCLQAAETKEKEFSVKSQITKSVTVLKAASVPPGLQKPPPPTKDSKFYVSIEITNKTSRPGAEIESLMRAAMQTKLLGQKGYAVAPKGETQVQGRQIVKSNRLKGFLLMATVESPTYEGGNLKQTVRLTVWSYPEKALKGEFALKLSQSNTSKGDTKSEELLMKMCVESAIDNFLKTADTL
jgi:hypothetical protein